MYTTHLTIMIKEAVLFGLNYDRTPNALRGCCNDARELANVLKEKFGFQSAWVIVDEDPMDKVQWCTRAGIERALNMLAQRSWDAPLDVAFLSFSGHGMNVWDISGDEADGLDEGLCPIDFRSSGLVLDDNINLILQKFNPATRVYIVVDACHSGTILDLPCHFTVKQLASSSTPSHVINSSMAPEQPRADIVGFSGCRDDQTSADAYDTERKQFGGALTSALLDTLRIKHSEQHSATSIHDIFHSIDALLCERQMTQRVVLSTTFTDTDKLKHISMFEPKSCK